MQENPIAAIQELKGRQGQLIDLLPYLNTSIFSCAVANAFFISDNAVLISVSGLTSTNAGTNEVTFDNLPFQFAYFTACYLFQDVYLGADNPNKTLLMPSGNSIVSQHPANVNCSGQGVFSVF